MESIAKAEAVIKTAFKLPLLVPIVLQLVVTTYDNFKKQTDKERD